MRDKMCEQSVNPQMTLCRNIIDCNFRILTNIGRCINLQRASYDGIGSVKFIDDNANFMNFFRTLSVLFIRKLVDGLQTI